MSVQDIVRAMQGALLQQDRLLKLDTPLGDNVLLPQRSLGWSRIGRHFDFTLDVLSTRNDLKLKSLIGQPVTLWNGLYTVTVLNAGSRSRVFIAPRLVRPLSDAVCSGNGRAKHFSSASRVALACRKAKSPVSFR